jgi:hypothetical protein
MPSGFPKLRMEFFFSAQLPVAGLPGTQLLFPGSLGLNQLSPDALRSNLLFPGALRLNQLSPGYLGLASCLQAPCSSICCPRGLFPLNRRPCPLVIGPWSDALGPWPVARCP